MKSPKKAVAARSIEQRIFLLRGVRVVLDADLAMLYRVTTKRLNEQVRRNLKRFPPDFMFQLSKREFSVLRSQFATSKSGSGEDGICPGFHRASCGNAVVGAQ
jgi:hypothetical protein